MRFGVIAEDWPSWSFALEAIGVKSIKTMMPYASNRIVQEVKETRLGGSLVDVKDGLPTVETVMGDREVVLLQGSDVFVEAMGRKVRKMKGVLLFGIVPDDRRETLCERAWPAMVVSRISHCQVGGVTRGRWKLMGDLRLRGIKSSPVKRVLKHVLGSTEMGQELSTDKPKKGLVSPDQRIPNKQRHVRVAAPCCFLKPKGTQVERELTDKEMMSAFDIEEGTQTALSTASKFKRVPLSRAFVLEAPIKVLYTAATAIMKEVKALDTERGNDDALNEWDTVGIASEGNGGQARKRTLISNDDGRMKKTKIHVEKASEASQVATKNDDAPVNVADWDIWSVNSYQHSANVTASDGSLRENPVKAMVCIPGSYTEDKHGRLFNALRKLLIRRVRRNATQGLLAYLRGKYGGTLRMDTVVYKKVKKKRNRKRRRSAIDESGDGPEDDQATLKAQPSTHHDRRLGRDKGRLIAYGPSGMRSFRVAAWTQRKLGKVCPKLGRGGDDTDVELFKDRKVGRDALTRLAESSWWQWDKGSTLFFWRWPARHRRSIRDGTKLFVKSELLPHFFKRQMWPGDAGHKAKMMEKLGKVRERGYVMPGEVQSLTGFFAVPKGDDDIRIVYDATACGLNAALWAPNFALPTIDSVLQNADSSTWFSDIDLGEMFLNYFLDEELRSYAGVDLREMGGNKKERWERTLMGFRPSPYICTQTFGWGESGIRGDRRDDDNPLRWDDVKLNLPGDAEYNPKMPWVYKWDEKNACLASDFGCYIDDIRGMGGSERACRQATRRVASNINYLGQQDAARKRRPPSRTPGAWAGAMCFSKDEGLFVTCSQKKWDKAKTIIKHWHEEVITQKSVTVNAAQMERDVGFLVHMSRTFPAIFPYLKGFYLTLNSWRTGRNDEGWKYSMSEWRAALGLDEDMPSYQVKDRARAVNPAQEHFDRPDSVGVVPRLQPDLVALMELFEAESPSHRLVRGAKLDTAKVVFGDASGGGFGSSWEKGKVENEESGRVGFRFGTWDTQSSEESSNYRELRNLTETLELMGKEGELSGTELFVFTDNSTAESAFAKGSSSSRKLFELVLRLRKLEMVKECKIHVSHVSGTRMIAQGSDGLSRGNMAEGVMRGDSMKDFVPINETALERHPKLHEWLKELTGHESKFLDAKGWFTEGQEEVEGEWEETVEGRRWPVTRPGSFVWTPPPAAAGIAVEQLRRSRHKSTQSTHVFVVPRLFSTEWRKQLHKVADVVLTVPAGHPAWPANMCEPLTIAFVFPFLSHRPWELRRAPKLMELERSLRAVWESNCESERSLLRELWDLPRRLASLSESMACGLLYGKRDHNVQNC